MLKSIVTRLKFDLREAIGSRPSLIPRLASGSKWEGGMVREDSVVCIEAFPRSANTFAVAAFKIAGNEGHIARHSHLGGQVLRSLDMKVPTLVIIREPLGAVASLKIRRPALGYAQMLRAYERFYRLLEDRKGEFYTARFEEITADFGAVMDGMNGKLGSSFAVFTHDEEGKKAVFGEIERMHAEFQQRTADGTRNASMIAIPQEGRSEEKEKVRSELAAPSLSGLIDRAKERYESFLNV